MKYFGYFLIFLFAFSHVDRLQAKTVDLDRIDPPSWWVGMKVNTLQLMVHGKNIGTTLPEIHYDGIVIKSVETLENPNYLFINLEIGPETKPGVMPVIFKKGKKEVARYLFPLDRREHDPAFFKGFDASDAIYLLMPDRFANGDTTNDNISEMLEKADRNNPNGRHGGDLKGIADHLDYIKDLGFTAIWINPLLENNMPSYSYHGYAMTDFYRVDPRYGSNEDYKKLVQTAHEKGLKIIQDMVFNHCGTNYYWKDDLPSEDWYNQWPEFTRSNYRGGVVTDPNASRYDYDRMVKGWFDVTMADLNQHNEFVANYLIQNSIWWIEYLGLDGIRQDTYPYPYKDFMAQWMKRLLTEYPGYNVVGEVWLNYPSAVAYWLENDRNPDGYHSYLTNVFDFPLMFAVTQAFNENDGWTTGLSRLYEVFSQDLVYSNPMNLVIFADNHDGSRIFTKLGEDMNRFKMAMTVILTARGIPQVYYGTEIAMTGDEHKGHGFIRKDFPGGWPGDSLNAFTEEGRTANQQEAFTFVKTLLNWRKNKEVVHSGKFKHFIPADDLYVYFRYDDSDTVMVILNNADQERTFKPERYNEMLNGHFSARSVMDGKNYEINQPFTVLPKSSLILEMD